MFDNQENSTLYCRQNYLMGVAICINKLRIGLHYHRYLKVKYLSFLSCFELLLVMSLILLKCGDIESNPGSFSESSSIFDTETDLLDLKL